MWRAINALAIVATLFLLVIPAKADVTPLARHGRGDGGEGFTGGVRLISVENQLHAAIQKYGPHDKVNGHNPYLWHLDKTGRELRPPQILYHMELHENPFCVVVAAQRSGKSVGKADKNLMDCACNEYEDLRYFAPAVRQAHNNIKINIDAIRRSRLLTQYVAMLGGRPQLTATGFQFKNGSNARCFGQDSEIDSENSTIIDVDEFDDFDFDTYKNRVLPRGVGKNRNGLPTRVRLSGTIQFQDGPLHELESDDNYHKVPKITLYHALELGLVDEKIFGMMQAQYTEEEWARIALCIYTESRNFFWSSKVRKCQQKALAAGFGVVEPGPGDWKDRSLYLKVGLGLDMGAQGTSDAASKYALTVWGLTGSLHKVLLYAKEYDPKSDPTVIKRDVIRAWSYFQPDKGRGDAFDANLIADMNDMLYDCGLLSFDRRREHAEHNPSNWEKWTFSPVRFEGPNKDRMFKLLQKDIHDGVAVIPMVEDERMDALNSTNPTLKKGGAEGGGISEGPASILKFITQLGNIRARRIRDGGGYNSYSMIKKKIGDDLVDSSVMAVSAIDTGLYGASYGSPDFTSSGRRLAALGQRW